MAPRAFAIAESKTAAIFKAHPTLRRPVIGAWTSWTFDLGPQTVTPPRTSPNQIRWWWIAITALGDFDPDKGGHLILWDLARILHFPPGTTVLLPPILEYSIAQIQPGETRYSLTHYAEAPPGWSRWPAPIQLFSKLRELPSLRT
ncbi:hypothetical protein B0H13DRAFT_1855400 [Mycena leptocephala]|nr:hypothetical protein B0H13DRAFT_1855400 [Mycena leptocephala]